MTDEGNFLSTLAVLLARLMRSTFVHDEHDGAPYCELKCPLDRKYGRFIHHQIIPSQIDCDLCIKTRAILLFCIEQMQTIIGRCL